MVSCEFHNPNILLCIFLMLLLPITAQDIHFVLNHQNYGDTPVLRTLKTFTISNEIAHISASATWKDQGWGNQKGRIYVRVKRHGTQIASKSIFPVAPHAWTTTNRAKINCNFDIVFQPNDKMVLEAYIGGGGGHTLEFRKLTFDVMYGPSGCPTESPTRMPTDKPTDNPTDKPSVYPTEYPSKYPTTTPTSRPTDPGELICGQSISGIYNNAEITFEVQMENDGDLIFDATNCEFQVIKIESFKKDNMDNVISNGVDAVILNNIQAGDYVFKLQGVTDTLNKQFIITTNCLTDNPTKYPSTNPSVHPSKSPSEFPTKFPSKAPSFIITSTTKIEPMDNFYESDNYIGITELLTTDDAVFFCKEEFNSNLATVMEENDEMEIEKEIMKPIYDDTGRNVVHFGYKDYNGIAKWIDGECIATNVLEDPWHTTATSPHKLQCGYFNLFHPMHFDIGSCTLKRYFICNNPNGKYAQPAC